MKFKRQKQSDGGAELLPEGKHVMKIMQVDEAVSKNGNEMMVLILETLDRRFKVKDYLVQTVEWKLNQMAEALGVDVDEGLEVDLGPKDLFHEQVVCDIVHEDQEWRTKDGVNVKTKKAKVKKYLPEDALLDEDLGEKLDGPSSDDDEEMPF